MSCDGGVGACATATTPLSCCAAIASNFELQATALPPARSVVCADLVGDAAPELLFVGSGVPSLWANTLSTPWQGLTERPDAFVRSRAPTSRQLQILRIGARVRALRSLSNAIHLSAVDAEDVAVCQLDAGRPHIFVATRGANRVLYASGEAYYDAEDIATYRNEGFDFSAFSDQSVSITCGDLDGDALTDAVVVANKGRTWVYARSEP